MLAKHVDLFSPKRGQYALKVNGEIVLAWTHKKVIVNAVRNDKQDTIWINKVAERFKLAVDVRRKGKQTLVTFEHDPESEEENALVFDAATEGKLVYTFATGEVS